ncbi:glycosyltransferase [Wenzhouxiangellaceae bacterium CH-27]|uniref:Glycosyltransferase n=2 Tax=Elongatibacter sediminis TaxID=3119006 RepID=A0AAW9RBD3_9GAMM
MQNRPIGVFEVTLKLQDNPSIDLLVGALREHPDIGDVTLGLKRFWRGSIEADIAHFHWPEVLFSWKPPNPSQLRRLVRCLQSARRTTRLIATVHNRFPHYRDSEISRQLYAAVYSHMDGIIHRGRSSLDEWTSTYPQTADVPHAIIPAGMPVNFPNTVSRQAARQHFRLDNSGGVYLSFGDMRHIEEGEQVLDGFRLMKRRDARLMVICRSDKKTRAQRFRRHWFRARAAIDSRVRFRVGRVPAEQVQYYVNSADVLVISRIHVLNSANLQLGFTFGKVVVGPDTGVVGEMLRETGNPVYAPGNPKSLAAALERAYALSQDGHGELNRTFARQHWNWPQIAQQHVDFFNQVLERGPAHALTGQ